MRSFLLALLFSLILPSSLLASWNTTTAYFTTASNGYEIAFTDSSSIYGSTTWLWHFGDGDSSFAQNPVHFFADSGWYNVCLSVVDTCGADTFCTSIYVTCPGAPVIQVEPQTTNGCDFGEVSYYLEANGQLLTYQWQENSGSGFANINDNLTYDSTQTDSLIIQNLNLGFTGFQYRCIVTNPCGERDTSLAAILFMDTLPVVQANASITSLCSGESTVLSGFGTDTYSWAPGTNLSATTGQQVTAILYSTTNFLMTGTDTTTGCSGLATVQVDVEDLPTISASTNIPIICVGDSVTLTALGGITYSWSPDSSLSASTGNSVLATPTVSTGYVVTGTNMAGCSSSGSVQVTVNPIPVLFADNQLDTIICPWDTVYLEAFGANTYIWSPSYGLLDTVGNQIQASPDTTVTYTVVGNLNGCFGSTTLTVEANNCIPDGIESFFALSIQVFQYGDWISISGLNPESDTRISLFNLNGQMVKQIKHQKGHSSLTLSELSLVQGLYLLSIQQNGKTITKKVFLR